MPSYTLPPNPSLEQLRKKAKELRDFVRTGHPKAASIVRAHHPNPPATGFTLADAQLVLARHHGFASWRRLREYLDMLARYSRSPQRRPDAPMDPADEFLRLACLTHRPSWKAGAGDDADSPDRHAAARKLLAAQPGIASVSLQAAVAAGDLRAARVFLAADPALANREGGPHGWPPLLYLALSRLDSPGAIPVARLLLEYGADPNGGYLPDSEPPPVTALSGVLRGRQDPANQPPHPKSLELARLLLEHGADPNDERAVDNACGYPHDDAALSLLLQFGLGRPEGGPWRARLGDSLRDPARLVRHELGYAAEMNLPGRVRLLLKRCHDYGIDLDPPDPVSDTPDDAPPRQTALDLATLNGNTEIQAMLKSAGARPSLALPADRLVAACLNADHQAAQRVLEENPDLVERVIAEDWHRPLDQAAILNRPEAARLLVRLGFPLNDRRGTPLHVAALAGQLEMVKLFIELGADPTAEAIEDKPGQFTPPDRTPLGWARYLDQREVVEYLASLGQP